MSRVDHKCAQCRRRFMAYKCLGQRFCSKDCADENRRHGCVLRCHGCRRSFYRRFGEQDLGITKRQFCTKPCYFLWRQRKRTSYPKIGAVHVHRLVAARKLGRPLRRGEIVHHIDHNKQNYDSANLVVLASQAEHARLHFTKGTK